MFVDSPHDKALKSKYIKSVHRVNVNEKKKEIKKAAGQQQHKTQI